MATDRDIDALIESTSDATALFIQPKKDKDEVSERVRSAVPDIFLCKICGDLPIEPHWLRCNCRGTLYCHSCIRESLRSDALSRCPNCRSPHQNAEALPPTDFGLQCMGSISVECRGEGCEWFGTHGQAKRHVDSCALLRAQNNERCKKALAGSVLNLEQRNLRLQALTDNQGRINMQLSNECDALRGKIEDLEQRNLRLQALTDRQGRINMNLSRELQSARLECDALRNKIEEVEEEKEKISKDNESLQEHAKALESENEELQEENALAVNQAKSRLKALEKEHKLLLSLKEENLRLKEEKQEQSPALNQAQSRKNKLIARLAINLRPKEKKQNAEQECQAPRQLNTDKQCNREEVHKRKRAPANEATATPKKKTKLVGTPTAIDIGGLRNLPARKIEVTKAGRESVNGEYVLHASLRSVCDSPVYYKPDKFDDVQVTYFLSRNPTNHHNWVIMACHPENEDPFNMGSSFPEFESKICYTGPSDHEEDAPFRTGWRRNPKYGPPPVPQCTRK